MHNLKVGCVWAFDFCLSLYTEFQLDDVFVVFVRCYVGGIKVVADVELQAIRVAFNMGKWLMNNYLE